jgi:hypothetical protein
MIRYLAYCDRCSDEMGDRKDTILNVLRKIEIGPDLWPLLSYIGLFKRKVEVDGREMGIYDQLVRYRFIRRTVTDVNRYAYIGTITPDMPYPGSPFNVLGLEELFGSPSPFSIIADAWKNFFEDFDDKLHRIVNGIIDYINDMVSDALDKCMDWLLDKMDPALDEIDDILKSDLLDNFLVKAVLGEIPSINKKYAKDEVKNAFNSLKEKLKIPHVDTDKIQDVIVYVTVKYVIPFMAWWRDLWIPVKKFINDLWEAILDGIMWFIEKITPDALIQYFGQVNDTIGIWFATFKHYLVTMFKELVGVSDIMKTTWHQIDKLFVALINTCWYCGRNNVPIPETFSEDCPSKIPLFPGGIEIELHDVNLKLEIKDISLPNPFPQGLIDAANWLNDKLSNSTVKEVLKVLGFKSSNVRKTLKYISGKPPGNRIHIPINETININIPADTLSSKLGIPNPIKIGEGFKGIVIDIDSKKITIGDTEKSIPEAIEKRVSIYQRNGHEDYTEKGDDATTIKKGTIDLINPEEPIKASTIKRVNPDFAMNGRPYLEVDDDEYYWYRYKTMVKDEKFVKIVDKSTENGITQWKVYLHPYQEFIDNKGKISLRYLEENGDITTKEIEVVKPDPKYPDITLDQWVGRYADKHWAYMPFPPICPFCGSTTSIVKVLMGAAESERADMIHSNRSGEFQIQLFKYIYEHESELSAGELEDLRAIAYGSMGHYVHDIICHPLVNAIGGSYRASRCKYCGGNLVVTPMDPKDPLDLRYFCEYEGCPINEAIAITGDLTVDGVPEDPMDIAPNLLADAGRRVEGLAMHGWIETIWDVWVWGNFHHRLNNKVIKLINDGELGNFNYLNNDYNNWAYPGIDMNKTILKSDFIWSGDEDENENYVSGLSHWVHLQDWLDPLGPDMIDPSNYSNEEEEKAEIEEKSKRIYDKHCLNSGVGFWLGRNDVPSSGDPYAGESQNPVVKALLNTYLVTFGKLSTWKKQWSGEQKPMISITDDEKEGQRQILYDYVMSWFAHSLRCGAVTSAPKYEKIMEKNYYKAFLTDINGESFSSIHEYTYEQRFMQSILLLAKFVKAGEDYLEDGDINKFRNIIGNFSMDSGFEVRLQYKKVEASPAGDKMRPVIKFQHIWNRAPDPITVSDCETEGPPEEEEEKDEGEVVRFELDGAHFNFDKIFPLFPDESKIFELPNIDYYDNTDYSITILGHTDKVGNQIYNKNLSLKRARVLFAFITGDLESLEEGNLILELVNDMQIDDIQLILNRINNADLVVDNDNGDKTKDAVRDFQKNNTDSDGNALSVDGIAGTKTKRAMVEKYLEWFNAKVELDKTRFLVDREWVGCGEYCFEEPFKTKSERNRRSEFLFFKPKTKLANLTECAKNAKKTHCWENIEGDPEKTTHRCKRYCDWLGINTTGTIE